MRNYKKSTKPVHYRVGALLVFKPSLCTKSALGQLKILQFEIVEFGGFFFFSYVD